jgi:glutamate synthase (NADPH/NADH) small chain
MGKPTGFIEYQRLSEAYEPAEARLKHYREFVARSRRAGQPAGRALHGLRHSVLQQRLPGEQHHSRLERPRLSRQLEGGARGPALDQQLPRFHRPDLPGAVRSGVHAEHQHRRRGHQVDRARDRRQGLGKGWIVPQPPKTKTGKKVAVVGSGPAGLAAAQQLARVGHDVVFEKSDRLGGLLRYGIPDFKMEKSHIDRRVEQMEAEGVEFRVSHEVGGQPAGDVRRQDFRPSSCWPSSTR